MLAYQFKQDRGVEQLAWPGLWLQLAFMRTGAGGCACVVPNVLPTAAGSAGRIWMHWHMTKKMQAGPKSVQPEPKWHGQLGARRAHSQLAVGLTAWRRSPGAFCAAAVLLLLMPWAPNTQLGPNCGHSVGPSEQQHRAAPPLRAAAGLCAPLRGIARPAH